MQIGEEASYILSKEHFYAKDYTARCSISLQPSSLQVMMSLRFANTFHTPTTTHFFLCYFFPKACLITYSFFFLENLLPQQKIPRTNYNRKEIILVNG